MYCNQFYNEINGVALTKTDTYSSLGTCTCYSEYTFMVCTSYILLNDLKTAVTPLKGLILILYRNSCKKIHNLSKELENWDVRLKTIVFMNLII